MPPLSKEGVLTALAKAIPEICPEHVDEATCEDVAKFLYSRLKEACFDEEEERRKKRMSGKSNWASFNAKRARKHEVKPIISDGELPKSPRLRLTCKTRVPLRGES